MTRNEIEEANYWISGLANLEDRIERLIESRDAHALKADMYRISNEMTAEIERLLALVDSRDDIIQGLHDENAALREGRQTPSEIKTLKDWRDAHAEIERLKRGLRNCRARADQQLKRKTGNPGTEHLARNILRFCDEAGVTSSIMREKEAHV